jgi:DNA polymerase-1
MGVSVAFAEGSEITGFYLPFRHTNVGLLQGYNLPFWKFRPMLQALLDNNLIIYHKAKFDLVSLETLGLDTGDAFAGRFACTMVLAHLLNENVPYTGKSLDSCARYYLNDDKGKRKDEDLKALTKNFGWGILTPTIICKYAVWDAVLTFQLFEALRPSLAKEGLSDVWMHKSDFMRLLIKMEKTGIKVDQELCIEMAEQGHKEMDRLKAELGFNPASTTELGQVLIEEMGFEEQLLTRKNGKRTRTFNKDAMEYYDRILEELDDPLANQIKIFRGWQKSTSSNYEPYVRLISPDGRIRTDFTQHVTVTGRLSSREPNLQQIPKVGDKAWNGRMKACFIPAPGYTLISVDFSQLELRLATVYAQEPTLKAAFLAGQDVFAIMAKELGMTRDACKTMVYLIQYGGKAHRASLSLKVSLLRAKELIDNFYRTYPRFRAVSDKYQHLAKKYGQVKLWTGRRRHFSDPDADAHKAFNSVIQGGAADIVERSLVKLDKRGLLTNDCRLLLQIHDEGLFEIKDEIADEATHEIAKSMAEVDFHPQLETVRFKAVGKAWGS